MDGYGRSFMGPPWNKSTCTIHYVRIQMEGMQIRLNPNKEMDGEWEVDVGGEVLLFIYIVFAGADARHANRRL
jgi:hypothetical protein